MYSEKYQITPVSLKTTKHDNAQEVSQERVTALLTLTCFSLSFASCQVDKI